MLKQLKLQNFKTHEGSELKFSSGINIITGESGHGKTNILRALNWIINNRPLGNSVIQRGEENCSATLTIDRNNDRYTIERVRGKSENSYRILDGKDKEIARFTFFGNSPPDDISKLINLSDINIQSQLKPYFLVLDSPGQVATYIRTLIRLDEIDQVVKCLSSKVRDKKSEILHLEDSLQEVKDKLEELNKIDLERLEQTISEAKIVVKNIQSIKEKRSRLEEITAELKALETKWVFLPKDVEHTVEETEGLCCKFIELSKKVNKLCSLFEELKKLKGQEITLPETTLIFSAIESTERQYNDIYEKVSILLSVQEQLQEVCKEISKVDALLFQLEEAKQLLMKQLDSCPYCGSKLTVESKKCLLDER